MTEATNNEHIKARQTIIERDGVPQPAPAPRFSRTAAEVQRSAPWPGQHTDEALADWGFDADEIAKLREAGAIALSRRVSRSTSASDARRARASSVGRRRRAVTVTWPSLRPGRGALP